MSWLEASAFAMALAMVALNMRVHPAAWPLAIASSALYGVVFRESGLYANAALQLVFIGVAAWGWWQWLRGQGAGGGPLVVRTLGPEGRAIALGAVLLAWPATAFVLGRYTDSTVPWWDAFPTAASLVGTVLLARKYVENWPAWVVVNAVAVALFVHQRLWLTAVLYAILLALAFVGWARWRRLAAAGAVRG